LLCRDKFDYILIETTGLADPGALASIFWLDEELECQVKRWKYSPCCYL
jgi:G3E family GTPase